MYEVDLKGYHSTNLSLVLYVEICWQDWAKVKFKTNHHTHTLTADIFHQVIYYII